MNTFLNAICLIRLIVTFQLLLSLSTKGKKKHSDISPAWNFLWDGIFKPVFFIARLQFQNIILKKSLNNHKPTIFMLINQLFF